MEKYFVRKHSQLCSLRN